MMNAILCHEAKGFDSKGQYGWRAMKAYSPLASTDTMLGE
jgi:hypothetical protein